MLLTGEIRVPLCVLDEHCSFKIWHEPIGGVKGLYMSHGMRKPTICIGENKAADQLCSNCTADQHLCFRCRDSKYNLSSSS